jgi:hypothetical protein
LHLSSRPTSHFLQVESSFTALVAVAWTSWMIHTVSTIIHILANAQPHHKFQYFSHSKNNLYTSLMDMSLLPHYTQGLLPPTLCSECLAISLNIGIHLSYLGWGQFVFRCFTLLISHYITSSR